MAKFIMLSRTQKTTLRKLLQNHDASRTFGVLCESYPSCTTIDSVWEPHRSVDVKNPILLAKEFARMEEKFLHHCKRCYAQALAAQPPGQQTNLIVGKWQRIEQAEHAYWQKRRAA